MTLKASFHPAPDLLVKRFLTGCCKDQNYEKIFERELGKYLQPLTEETPQMWLARESVTCLIPVLWALVERSLWGWQETVISPCPSLLGVLMGAGGTGGLFLKGGFVHYGLSRFF